MPARDRAALIEKAEMFAIDPFAAHAWAKPLRCSSDRARVRQGAWRAIFRISRARQTVTLERVAHRREAYR